MYLLEVTWVLSAMDAFMNLSMRIKLKRSPNQRTCTHSPMRMPISYFVPVLTFVLSVVAPDLSKGKELTPWCGWTTSYPGPADASVAASSAAGLKTDPVASCPAVVACSLQVPAS